MAEAKIELDLRQWQKLVDDINSGLRDASGLLLQAWDAFGFQDIMDHFRKEEGPSGKWKARSPVTNMIYDLIGAGKRKPPAGSSAGSFSSSNKLLQLTGALRQSILPAKKKSSHSIVIVANKEYSGIHDRGGRTRFGTIPQRQFMWLSPSVGDKMAQMILKLLIGEK